MLYDIYTEDVSYICTFIPSPETTLANPWDASRCICQFIGHFIEWWLSVERYLRLAAWGQPGNFCSETNVKRYSNPTLRRSVVRLKRSSRILASPILRAQVNENRKLLFHQICKRKAYTPPKRWNKRRHKGHSLRNVPWGDISVVCCLWWLWIWSHHLRASGWGIISLDEASLLTYLHTADK